RARTSAISLRPYSRRNRRSSASVCSIRRWRRLDPVSARSSARNGQSGATRTKPTQWDKLLKDTGAKSQQDILADIGLGKRLAVVVARRLLSLGDVPGEEHKAGGAVMIRGSEGMAVQFAQCCTPIPGDPIIGLINKGQGMAIHTHD